MKLAHTLVVCLVLAVTPVALAQKWEIGGGGGGGFTTSKDVKLPAESATAKIAPGVAGAFWLSNNTNARWGGELRYVYQNGELQVKQDSTKATFSGESHTMHYDFQWHASDMGSKSRPYLAFGGGVKVYRGVGEEANTQPLSRFILLTKTQELQGMISIGAGIKTKINNHWQFRLDVHDYITRFPKEVMQPNLGAQVGGWLHNIVPMAGLTWTR